MNALLLASQLIIPQIPAGVTEQNVIQETIKTYSCVKDVEEDGIVHILNGETGAESEVVRLIVTAKNKRLVDKCAKLLVSEIEGLKLEQTFTIIPAFVVSYEVPDLILNNEIKKDEKAEELSTQIITH